MKTQSEVILVWTAMAMLGVAALAGCNQSQSLFKKPSSTLNPTAQTSAPNAPAPNAPVQPNVPYELSANSSGNFIEFSIYNMGNTELPVKRENFAVISPNDHSVTPYSRDSAVIDLPQPAVVQPNSTLKGRAIFKSISNPTGQRLVFKPDNIGTFADINRQ